MSAKHNKALYKMTHSFINFWQLATVMMDAE